MQREYTHTHTFITNVAVETVYFWYGLARNATQSTEKKLNKLHAFQTTSEKFNDKIKRENVPHKKIAEEKSKRNVETLNIEH